MPTNTHAKPIEFVVPPGAAGERLDRFLVSQLTDLSRSRIQSLMSEGRILVDGAARKASHRIEAGETITVDTPAPPPPGVEPEHIPLDVLYEDADVAVINKPAGMIVHPGAGADTGTLVAALLDRYGARGLSTVGGPLRPGIVHRLDKLTSGAVVIARTDAAHAKLVNDFRDRLVEKEYVALLHGRLKSNEAKGRGGSHGMEVRGREGPAAEGNNNQGTIELPVSRDLRRRSRMTARRREGRPARTDWRVLLRLGAFTLIRANLHTGRTHQIRVHFSALGCPVVGDTLYGAPRQERIDGKLLPPLERNFLHAARIAFAHPRTARRIEVRAPLPADLVSYLHSLASALKSEPASIDAALKEFL
jgi:23S rRNA pseudouridine1911/1915/1917 synthase